MERKCTQELCLVINVVFNNVSFCKRRVTLPVVDENGLPTTLWWYPCLHSSHFRCWRLEYSNTVVDSSEWLHHSAEHIYMCTFTSILHKPSLVGSWQSVWLAISAPLLVKPLDDISFYPDQCTKQRIAIDLTNKYCWNQLINSDLSSDLLTTSLTNRSFLILTNLNSWLNDKIFWSK